MMCPLTNPAPSRTGVILVKSPYSAVITCHRPTQTRKTGQTSTGNNQKPAEDEAKCTHASGRPTARATERERTGIVVFPPGESPSRYCALNVTVRTRPFRGSAPTVGCKSYVASRYTMDIHQLAHERAGDSRKTCHANARQLTHHITHPTTRNNPHPAISHQSSTPMCNGLLAKCGEGERAPSYARMSGVCTHAYMKIPT